MALFLRCFRENTPLPNASPPTLQPSTSVAILASVLLPLPLAAAAAAAAAVDHSAGTGLLLYVVPQWRQLFYSRTWVTAGSQIFHSLGIAWGSLVTFASFNPVKNDLFKDAFVLTSVSAFTSLFAGFVVFPIVGFMALVSGRPVEEVRRGWGRGKCRWQGGGRGGCRAVRGKR